MDLDTVQLKLRDLRPNALPGHRARSSSERNCDPGVWSCESDHDKLL